MYASSNFEADARPPGGSFLAPVQLRRLDQGEAGGASSPVQAVLSRGKLNDGRLPDGEMAANLEERNSQAVRSAGATVPSGTSADRDSWAAGIRPAAQWTAQRELVFPPAAASLSQLQNRIADVLPEMRNFAHFSPSTGLARSQFDLSFSCAVGIP
jgi:hypothetical protein